MLTGLIVTAFLMGLGGIPHCAAMCGAACAAALPRGLPLSALLGRCVGYAMLGAVAASAAGLISQWGRQVSMLQPFWIMLQMAAVFLGVWLVWTGRVPHQLEAWGQGVYHRFRARARQSTWLERHAWLNPLLPFFGGLAWAVLPCGLLYAALMVAALASTSWGGGLVMLAFAAPSGFGVWLAPAILQRLSRRQPAAEAGEALPVVPVVWLQKSPDHASGDASVERARVARGTAIDSRWAVRLSGLCLAAMAGWAVSHQLMAQWQAWCA